MKQAEGHFARPKATRPESRPCTPRANGSQGGNSPRFLRLFEDSSSFTFKYLNSSGQDSIQRKFRLERLRNQAKTLSHRDLDSKHLLTYL